MSVQFGRWNLEGKPVGPDYLEAVSSALRPYGPDGNGSYATEEISIVYHAFHTTKESHTEVQPYICASGAVIVWDGRLDDRAELIRDLREFLIGAPTDVAIVAAAYEAWSTRCFSKLVGDWALSIWDSKNRSLVLAKDPIGTRHLYYRFDSTEICWSTILDPLVRLAGRTFALDEEYIAGWLSMFPATHLTPCVGVHSVPPSSFVLLEPAKRTVSKYWDFNPNRRIRYKTDAEYEEHFRTVFGTAVERRLRSDRAVLAELSGGRDSSSIVCMADKILADGIAQVPRVDTISYYDDTEPNWDDHFYFTKVEEKRGRTGCHVCVRPENASSDTTSDSAMERGEAPSFPLNPGHDGHSSPQVKKCLSSQDYRAVLSGIGGDEVMGGIPAPALEVADLLARARFSALPGRLKVWALDRRIPWFHILAEALMVVFPGFAASIATHNRGVAWLRPAFVKQHKAALAGYPVRTRLFGPLPTFQDNLSALESLRRQLGCKALPIEPPFERRYPYLDVQLMEFMFSIPREQVVRPSHRRSLMRRALVGIVPSEILNRKRKAFIVRAPMVDVSHNWSDLVSSTRHSILSSYGIVDAGRLLQVLRRARRGEEVPLIALTRTLAAELWLRRMSRFGDITNHRMPMPPVGLQWDAAHDQR